MGSNENVQKGAHDKAEGPKPEKQQSEGGIADHVANVYSKNEAPKETQGTPASSEHVKDGQLVVGDPFSKGSELTGLEGATNAMAQARLEQMMNDVVGLGREQQEIPEVVHPGQTPGGFIPPDVANYADNLRMEDFKKDIMEKFSSLSPEKQKEVDAGVEAVEKHDAKAVAKFLESATPEQKAAFKKELEEKGYKINEKVVSAPIGGAYVTETEIIPPNGPFGHSEYEIKIRESSNGSLGPKAPPPDVEVNINLLR